MPNSVKKSIRWDYKKAFEWLEKATENNFADSRHMGNSIEGFGTKKYIAMAIYWLNEAKENEDLMIMNYYKK
ncbi:hypothetical protein Glove_194g98 [Diversispora epigaea]|uniref:Uncharacterized protein n=1 Tax=Diversispora epigaea TaxID=1348612 RepID=A0A397IL55_9GLOM|nr:hypothetical protein Glove_194g98 [Diversispora epigaea]